MLTRFKNLNLRFVGEEGEGGGGDEGAIVTDPSATPPVENDLYAPIRSELDPISFSRIESHLKDMDRNANSRIQKSTEALKPYQPFIDAGVSVEDMQAGLQLAQQINSDPVQIYEALGSYLEREGRLPTKQELKDEIADNKEGVDPNAPEAPAVDPRLSTIEQQNQQIMEFLQQQEQQKLEVQADNELNTEIATLKSAHPELGEDDVKEIISRAAFEAQTSGKIPTLQSVHDGWYQGLRSRFLTTPRPGDSAPKLVPTSGGLPSNVPQKTLGQLSRQETQDIIASMIEQNKD